MARIELICKYNAFKAAAQMKTGRRPSESTEKYRTDSSAVFIMPSYINHSCLGKSMLFSLG